MGESSSFRTRRPWPAGLGTVISPNLEQRGLKDEMSEAEGPNTGLPGSSRFLLSLLWVSQARAQGGGLLSLGDS